jgi:hypothetical protein
MKQFIFCLSLICFIACNNNSRRKVEPKDLEQENDTVNKEVVQEGDFHTTYTDVIDNLFLYINKKNWAVANSFYADSANNTKNASFFKKLFEKRSIEQLELINSSKKGNAIYVLSYSKEPGNSNTKALCFIFELEGNNIQSQKEVPCDQ